jgi:HCOMODA/2-hydroxy-3-carboxy-muconic semialdehyde decarboxylase
MPGADVERIRDLVLAYKILVNENVLDSFGHVSVRSAENPDRFLMPSAMPPSLVVEHDIIPYRVADSQPFDTKRRVSGERYLHGEIYKARPDVMAIAHSHSAAVIPFGLVQTPMVATYHNAAFLAAGVPVFDIREKFGTTDIVVSTPEKGAALAEVLADKPVALLRAHGVVVVGPSLRSAVFRAVFTEVSARIQLQAAMLGGPIAALDAEEGRLADAVNLATDTRAWELWKRRVTR